MTFALELGVSILLVVGGIFGLTGSYGLLNLTASYPLTSSLEAQLRWNNVLNKDYTLARGYNNAGSSVFLNFAWRM